MQTLASRLVAAMERKGYRLDRGPGEVTIVYVEGLSPDGTANGDAPNEWNDLRVVLRFEGGAPKILGAWEATTEPGRYYTDHPVNPKGAARIAFGQYQAWRVGVHRGDHEALVQTGGAVTVCRDANRDMIRPGDARDTGYFGINQHWGYDLPSPDRASAGCLVGRTREGHREFMALVKTDPRYRADREFVFTTAILAEADVLAEGAPARPLVAATDRRRSMAQAILGFEARRDSRGRLAVYALPPGDGGGTYEVAGINDRYHPAKAAELRALIEAGRHDDAERVACDYILAYTDVVVGWYPPVAAGVEFYLRDCAFNRGPSGAARILQRALRGVVDEDGIVGPLTKAAVVKLNPGDMLVALRRARESYERSPVGRDEWSALWRGLVSRWDEALAFAHSLAATPTPQPQPEPVPPPPAPPSSPGALDEAAIVRIVQARVEACIRAIAADIQAAKETAMSNQNLPAHFVDPAFAAALAAAFVKSLGAAAQPAAPAPAAQEPPVMSTIDKVLGGRAMLGKKTLTGLIGIVGSLLGYETGIDPGNEIVQIVLTLSTGLFGAGVLAKVDRVIKTVTEVAPKVLDALNRVSAGIDAWTASQPQGGQNQ